MLDGTPKPAHQDDLHATSTLDLLGFTFQVIRVSDTIV